jgi:IS66 C-terminal element
LKENHSLFAGSERGADPAAVMATLIVTAKLNEADPQAWLADVLARTTGRWNQQGCARLIGRSLLW